MIWEENLPRHHLVATTGRFLFGLGFFRPVLLSGHLLYPFSDAIFKLEVVDQDLLMRFGVGVFRDEVNRDLS